MDELILSASQVRVLCQALTSSTACTRLYLSRRSLKDEDGAAIGQVLLLNKSIRSMALERNRFGPKTMESFARGIANNRWMESLSFESSDITSGGQGIEEFTLFISATAGNTSLRHLNLAKCGLDERCGALILDCVRRNATLTQVVLSGNHIDKRTLGQIEERMVENREAIHSLLSSELAATREMAYSEVRAREYRAQLEDRRAMIEIEEKAKIDRARRRVDLWGIEHARATREKEALITKLAAEFAQREAAAVKVVKVKM